MTNANAPLDPALLSTTNPALATVNVFAEPVNVTKASKERIATVQKPPTNATHLKNPKSNATTTVNANATNACVKETTLKVGNLKVSIATSLRFLVTGI